MRVNQPPAPTAGSCPGCLDTVLRLSWEGSALSRWNVGEKVENQDPGQHLENDDFESWRPSGMTAIGVTPSGLTQRPLHLSSSGNCHWLSASLIRVSQEVNYLAPVTQTLSKPCYFARARTESENSMTHKTENWRVFSTRGPGPGCCNQSEQWGGDAEWRDWHHPGLRRVGTNSLPHDNILLPSPPSTRSRLSVQTTHINTQRDYWLHLSSMVRLDWEARVI